jgi:hypothetical protein
MLERTGAREFPMPRRTVDFETVRELALALPEVQQASPWGALGFKARGKLMACQAIHSSAEPDTLMVRIDKNLRDELLASEPSVYYLTPHYENYPSVLVRLARTNRNALKKLLGVSWLFVTSDAPKGGAKRNKTATTKRRRAER